MAFLQKNDFLHTIRYLVWIMKMYGVHMAPMEELQQRKSSKCQWIVRSIPPIIMFVYITAWTVSLTELVMKSKSDEISLYFFAITIIFSSLSALTLAILIVKRRKIEEMAAQIQLVSTQSDYFVFNKGTRIAVISYVISPFVLMFFCFCYLAYLVSTNFSSEERFYNFFLMMTDNVIFCPKTNQLLMANETNSYCAQVKTYTIVPMMFVWTTCVLSCLMHSIGLVIIVIFCIYHYFGNFISKNFNVNETANEYDQWSHKITGRYDEDNIRNCIDAHRSGCRMVKDANTAMKELCFALSAAEVLIIIFSFRGMNLKNPQDGLGMKTVLCNLLAYFTFIMRAVMASKVNRQVMASLKVMLKVEPKISSECPSPKVAKWIKGYVRHVKLDPPSFTGWGLYRFTEGCILTVSGHILTYTLTLYGIGG